MLRSKNIHLRHHADGTPSVMRKPVVYTELHFYRKSDVLVQLTKAFCKRFLPAYGDRTVDQMVQAARSIKQNIAEGFTDGMTSFETEIKLLGIARGSNQELLEDYTDYLKHHGEMEWATGNTERFNRLRDFCKNSDNAAYEPFYQRWTDIEMANCAICLCHMVDRAMARYMEQLDREFVEEGGVRERMTAARSEARGSQKELIASQEAEIARLREQVASLQRELALARSGKPGNPGRPGSPGNPGSPDRLTPIPGNPENPGSPDRLTPIPGNPETPGNPGRPGNPGSPETPGRPGRPGNPGGPGNPGRPEKTDNDQ